MRNVNGRWAGGGRRGPYTAGMAEQPGDGQVREVAAARREQVNLGDAVRVPKDVLAAIQVVAEQQGVPWPDLVRGWTLDGLDRTQRAIAGKQVLICYECPRELRAETPFSHRGQLRQWAAGQGWTLRADPFTGWPHDLCPDHAHLAPDVERW